MPLAEAVDSIFSQKESEAKESKRRELGGITLIDWDTGCAII